MRKDIQVATLNKIKKLLKEQLDYIFKVEIVRQIGVDYNSLNIALKSIKHRTDKEGRIKIQ